MISIVSPVYKAEHIVEKLVSEIQKSLLDIGLPFEIILVDDRSPDGSWAKMQMLSAKYPEVKSIRLSRNFGQHPAIMAGLSKASGEWIVVMDCDLQDQPKEIKKLYQKTFEGFDVVLARRIDRQDGFFKKLSSKVFSLIFNYFSDIEVNNEVANFGIYHKRVIQAVLNMGDSIKFFPLFVYFVGFNTTAIPIEHAERDYGKSSYSLSKLMALAFNAIVSYSSKPLRLFMQFGLFVSFFSFLIGLYQLVLYLFGSISVSGYTSIILAICFFSGIIITVVGMVGMYVGKVFEQTKNRPVFIVDQIIN
jgi:glycosyltransferase involved in cell wall biosynthesis